MRLRTTTALIGFLLATAACSKADKREWSASDHDHAEEAPAQQRAPSPQPAATAQNSGDDPWSTTCAPCHGPAGKGDGPMGPAMRVPDLSNKDWQAKISDQQIAETIKTGRGRMPGFGSMPASSIDALVKHVRSFK